MLIQRDHVFLRYLSMFWDNISSLWNRKVRHHSSSEMRLAPTGSIRHEADQPVATGCQVSGKVSMPAFVKSNDAADRFPGGGPRRREHPA
jgi:hypothetical protein